MVIITTTSLPRPIIQAFDRTLLSRPVPIFGDTAEKIWDMHLVLMMHVERQTRHHGQKKKALIQNLKEQFEIEYERIKAEEENAKAKGTDPYAGFGKRLSGVDRGDDEILYWLKRRVYSSR